MNQNELLNQQNELLIQQNKLIKENNVLLKQNNLMLFELKEHLGVLNKMDNHIDNVMSIYNVYKKPLNYISSYFGGSNSDVPEIN